MLSASAHALSTWIASHARGEIRALALRVGCSSTYICNLRKGLKKPARLLAIRLEAEVPGATVGGWDTPQVVA